MLRRHDHAIFFVPDPAELDTVADRFAAAGFLITERDDLGKETAATVQKLICFADSSYIEILTIRDEATRARHRFAHLLPHGNGWADYSIDCVGLDEDRDRIVAAGLPIGGPHEHKRSLRDGRPWAVRLILLGIGAGFPALPFLLEDSVGRELRIPTAGTQHPNGVTGIAGITVAVRSPAQAKAQFDVVFGDGTTSGHGLRYWLGSQWVDVVQGEAATSEGVSSITLLKPGAGAPKSLGTGLALFVAGA
ncbi:MAG: VOC family protein [Rhizobiales bacterium]|nr:VOC family protein [Hyphomicrobiales bacterium]